MAEQFSNDIGTTLSAPIVTAVRPVTFSVASGSGWPGSPQFRVVFGVPGSSETILVTAVNGGNSYTGTTVEGSSASTWITGTPAAHVLTAGALAQLKADAISVAVVSSGGITTVSFSATPTFDASVTRSHKITLTGNITSFSISNGTPGQFVILDFIQDGTGGRTVAGAATIHGFGGVGGTASTHSVWQLVTTDGTQWYALSTGSWNQA